MGQGGFSVCRSALEDYSKAMGELQRCSVVSILPSNICQSCLVAYAQVLDSWSYMDAVSFNANFTCMQFYRESGRRYQLITTDSYMFTHTFMAATNQSSPFARANCRQCYQLDAEKGELGGEKSGGEEELTADAKLKDEVRTYLRLYDQAKDCFMNWEFVDLRDDNKNLVCRECQESFAKSQNYFEENFLKNDSFVEIMTSLCLDIADRYQELNQLYEGFSCRPEPEIGATLGSDFGAYALLLLIFFGCYATTISNRLTDRSILWTEGSYVKPLLYGETVEQMDIFENRALADIDPRLIPINYTQSAIDT